VTRPYRWLAVLIVAFASAAFAQQARVPTVTITAIEAKSTDPFSPMVAVRGLSDGNVIVADPSPATRRMVLLDASMARVRVIMDSAAMNLGSNGLIPFAGDSTVVVEMSSQTMLVMDPTGKVARVMAPPKAQDIFLLSGSTTYGAPGIDPLGRLVYRANYRIMPKPNAAGQMMMPPPPETAPIVRASFDSRSVDTIGEVGLPVMAKIPPMPMGTTEAQMSQIKAEVNPMATGDEWAMLADGSIAVIRWLDYHIDWIDVNGSRRSSPKIPFDWRKVTDDEKQFKVDSMKKWLDSLIAAQMARPMPPGMPPRPVPKFGFIPLDEMPAYHPPIRPGSVKADRDNNLWILPTTSADAKNGLLYDVVNRNGELFQRVQLPAGAVVAGFGKGGVVYLLQPAGDNKWSLGRARVAFGVS
jgi:hypothetical protein